MALIAAVSAYSQTSSAVGQGTQISTGESSSSSFQMADDDSLSGAAALKGAALSLNSDGGGGAAGQDYGTHHGGRFSLSHLAFEVGGGFNAPIGNDTPYITWGGQFFGGAGLHLTDHFSVLGEFSFMDNKLPGALVAAGGGQTGNAHIIGLTAEPVFDFMPKRSNDAYIIGGGGYYHKSTNFNIQECCDFYGYPVSVTANSFSSNQGGLNFGFGITHKLGGGAMSDSQMKLFAEARYVYIHTPAITENNGLGTTELIPASFGVRW